MSHTVEYTYSCSNGCGRTVTMSGAICGQCSATIIDQRDAAHSARVCKDCKKPLPVDYAYTECNECWNKKIAPGRAAGYTYGAFTICNHPPKKVYATKYYRIYGAKKGNIPANAKLDLLLNLTSLAAFDEVTLPMGYEELAGYVGPRIPEIVLSWPDMSTPLTPFAFWPAFSECLIKNAKQAGHALRICACCAGGHGRTGTALAALTMHDMGFNADEAIAYVRKHYCKEAVEAKSQESYLDALDKFLAKAGK